MQQEKKYGKCPQCDAPCEVTTEIDVQDCDGDVFEVPYDQYKFHPQHPGTSIWVKASDRLPGWGTHVKWRLGNGPETNRKIAFSEMNDNNLKDLSKWEWLDESESPSKEGDKEWEVCDFAEWLRLNYKSSQNGWVDALGKWDTTFGLYQLWNNQQNRNNVNS